MKNKHIIILISLLYIAWTLLGCSTKTDESINIVDKEIEDNNEESTELTIALRTFANSYVERHPNINDDKYVKKLEELTNTALHIKLIPHSYYKERMLLMLASDDKPDVMQGVSLTGPELGGGVEEGAFLPLNDLLEQYGQNLLRYIPEKAWEQMTYSEDGKIYAIPEFLSEPSRRGMAIRLDLLEKTGLSIPETTDEYLEVLRAFKKIGVENPFQGRENFHYADTFFGAFDALPYQWEYDKESEQVVPKFVAQNGEKVKKAIKFYRTMYEEELIDPDFLTIPQAEYRNNIMSGKAGMWSMNAEELVSWEREIKNNIPHADIAIIPSPKEPGGKGGHAYYENVTRSYFISSESKVDPAKIIQFFDWQVTEEGQEFFTYGIEGDTYTKNDGKINYELENEEQFLAEQYFRTSWLWMVRDATYTEDILQLTKEGQDLINVFDDVLSKEGHGSIKFSKGLQAFKENPEIEVSGVLAPEFWMKEIAKIITGHEPLHYHDQVVDVWLKQGGQRAINEATERYHHGDYVNSDPNDPA